MRPLHRLTGLAAATVEMLEGIKEIKSFQATDITRTLPLEIYLSREADTETALALAVVLIAVAAALMAVSALVARRAVVGRG